ncbi:hypothetical protein JXQ70_15075 [bacterium]|nr:hypothetical protein [bacterium]
MKSHPHSYLGFVICTAIFLGLWSLFSPNSLGRQNPKIGVLALFSDDLTQEQRDLIQTVMSEEIGEIKKRSVVPVNTVRAKLEADKSPMTCSDLECARRVGATLDADILVFGLVHLDRLQQRFTFQISRFELGRSESVIVEQGWSQNDFDLLFMALMTATRKLFSSKADDSIQAIRKESSDGMETETDHATIKPRRFFHKEDTTPPDQTTPPSAPPPVPIIINHVPPEHGRPENNDVPLIMTFVGGPDKARVLIHYRFNDDDNWRSQKMKMKDIRHFISVPYRPKKQNVLEYYFVVVDKQGNVLLDDREHIYRVDLF